MGVSSLPPFAIAAALLAGAAPCAAQLPPLDEYRVRAFGPEDGLPLTEVWDVARDADGRLIASTPTGLFRYTGYRFVPLELGELRGQVFRDLEASGEGDVWFVTAEGKVGRVRDGRARLVAVPPIETWRLQSDDDGGLWAVGMAGLARIYPSAPGGYRSVPELDGVATGGVFRVGDALLAVSETGGHRITGTRRAGAFLASDAREAGALRAEPVGDVPAPGSLTILWQDEQGVWIPLTPREDALALVHAGGVVRFGPGDAPYDEHAAEGRRVRRSVPGADGERWWSYMDGAAVSHLVRDRDGVRTVVDARRDIDFGLVRNLLVDGEGIVWVTTDQGLRQLAPRAIHSLAVGDGGGATFTAPILQDSRGSVWVGTWGRGLVRYDGGPERVFTVADGLPSARVRALHEAGSGSVWVGTGNGLARIAADRVVEDWPWDEVRVVVRGSDGETWVGGHAGLRRVQGPILVPVNPEVFEGKPVYALHLDRGRRLWIGTDHGLYSRTPDGTLARYGSGDGLRHDWIDSIHEEPDGTLWIGTYNAGIHRYRGERFVPVTTAEGLHHDGIWSMLPDDLGGVWMSSDVGLARVDHTGLHKVADAVERGETPAEQLRPLVFTEASGMPSRESNRASPAGWRLHDGRLVFNNVSGVVVVDPARALGEAAPPGADVTAFSIDGRETLARSGPVVVPAGTRHLGIDFAAHALAVPEQNRYRVRLEGFDSEWVEVGTRHRVEYTALPPGRYAFHLQAARPLGEWGEASVLPIHIQPFPWQTAWFRFVAALLLAGSLLAAHRIRVLRAVATERMRLRIAADLHDDVGANLVSIALLSDLLEKSLENTSVEEQHRRLRRIRTAAQSTVDSLRNIIWLVDPTNDRLDDLVERLHDLAAGLVPEDRLTVRSPTPGADRALGMERARNTLLVFKEALQNAVKHGGPETVAVAIEVASEGLSFTVSDGGPGFDPETVGGGYGLANMRRRAAEAGAELTVASSHGEGTVVTFFLPVA
jgi:signal transduction histidine kinase